MALILWDVVTGEQVRVFERYTTSLTAACFLPDGKHLLCAAGGNLLNLWNVETGEEIWWQTFPAGLLALSRDGKTSATATSHARYNARGIRFDLWDAATGKHQRTLSSAM